MTKAIPSVSSGHSRKPVSDSGVGSRPAAPGGSSVREIELKLYVAPGDLARLARHPALAGLHQGSADSRRLYTVYFDTPDLQLAAQGVALRVRRDGRKRVQTVKTMNSGMPGDAAAVAVRREWEWPIPTDDPDIALLKSEGVRELVPQDALTAIRPMFVTDFQRTTLVLNPDSLTAIEVALDTGEIRAGATHRPISEIELELRAGSVGPLFDLALDLQRIVPLRIATTSKAEAGFALVTGRAPQARKAPPLGLTPAVTVAEGFRHIVRNCLNHVLANDACVLGDADEEGIHQMRVALRRLRSAFTLFEEVLASPDAAPLADEVRWLAERLGPARDWDILQTHFFGPFARKHDNDDGVRRLGQAIAESRRMAHARAIEALRSPRYTTLLLGLAGWLESGRWQQDASPEIRALLASPLKDKAGVWLGERDRRLRKAGRQIGKLDADQRHRVRIRAKKLRYAADFFRGLYAPSSVRPYLDRIEGIQEVLGTLNDAEVARRLVAALAEEAGRDMRPATEDLTRWLDRHSRRHLADLPDQWRDFNKAEPFWI
jgi:triphosphatase